MWALLAGWPFAGGMLSERALLVERALLAGWPSASETGFAGKAGFAGKQPFAGETGLLESRCTWLAIRFEPVEYEVEASTMRAY